MEDLDIFEVFTGVTIRCFFGRRNFKLCSERVQNPSVDDAHEKEKRLEIKMLQRVEAKRSKMTLKHVKVMKLVAKLPAEKRLKCVKVMKLDFYIKIAGKTPDDPTC